MSVPTGYRINEKIHEGPLTLICRASRAKDDHPVILKMLRSEYPSQGELVRLRSEYQYIKNLHDDNIIKAYDYEEQGKTAALILEDFGGTSLDRILSAGRLNLEACLHIGLELVKALEALHARQIVHSDINPSNIVWNRESDEVKLIDFAFASTSPKGRSVQPHSDVAKGTLAYISPEQTGRINRVTDHRSDMYSLGATLYELVTGRPPFPANDALELVHAHIAKQPTPPQVIDQHVPQALSAVIMKLLAKTAEERYQSTYGLKHDLEICLQQLQSDHPQGPFVPGEMDISSTFTVSQKLYGREQEIAILLDAIDRVNRGSSELAMIGGYSGVGKTSLVREIQPSIVEREGYFASGKFDQLNRSIPYHAFIQAFKELVRQLLSESEERIQKWRQRLSDTLAPNGQVVVSVIPEVEHIIGPQPPVPELPPQESQNRFNLVFQHFIRAFSSAEHPLTLFLDDLQWADAASLRLLELFMCDGYTQHLLILGAYRDNEVDNAHPLRLALDQIRKCQAKLSEITLEPLALQHTKALITDSLHADEHRVDALARICMDKTLGNPFFLTQLLHSLHGSGYISFDSEQGQWTWDLKRIAGAKIADSVVDLMVEKIHRLPEITQTALKLSASIGNQFDLKTLAIVYERPMGLCLEILAPAVQSGLICPNNDINLHNEEAGIDLWGLSYRFLHDRVHQAAYSLIDDSQKQDVHLQIGRLLLQQLDPEQQEEQIFRLANHLNFGITLISDPKEREQLAKINLHAGQKAKQSAASSTALSYLTQGIELLTDKAWNNTHELAITLHEEAAEAAYLSQHYEEMEALIEQVLTHTQNRFEKAKAYHIRILANTARYQLKEAVETGLEFLDSLDVHFPQPVKPEYIGAALAHVNETLGERTIDSLSSLPRMTNPKALVIMDTLTTLASPAYNHAPELFLLLVLKQVELSLTHGNADNSAFAYSTYALVLCALEERYDDGDSFGRLSIDLMERLNTQSLKAKIYLDVYLFVHHWKHPLRETLQPLLEAYRSGLEQGDLLFASLSAHVYCHHSLFSARYLPETLKEFDTYHTAIARLDQKAVLHWTEIFQQTALNLSGRNDDTLNLNGDAFSEVDKAYLIKEGNDKTACFLYYFNKLILCYLFGAYDQALTHAQRAEEYIHSVMGIIHVPLCRFYAALTHLALADTAKGDQRKASLAIVDSCREQLKKWADNAPMNYAHKHLLVEAETWRVRQQPDKAESCYDQAITLAAETGYTQDEALANELAGRHYLEKGRPKIAHMYLSDALYAYGRWGADAKVQALKKQYQELLTGTETHMLQPSKDALTRSGETHMHSLDLASVLKVSQTIAGEIVLERLLNKVMSAVMENAGAQKGFLINSDQEGQLNIEVGIESGAKAAKVFHPLPLEAGNDLSVAIVHYAARTGEQLVLNNASNEGIFTADPYVLKHRPKSILCMPLSNRGRLTAILYLENNLMTDAFTPNHLELLNLLSSQMAVSIENAKLYVGLEERVARRTEQLNEKVDELSQAYEALKVTQDELKHANAKLERDKELLQKLSSTDRLTGLYNRTKFEEIFEYELHQCHRYNTPMSLIMVDVDHFKSVNDTYGHHTGDLVLKDVASILNSSSRKTDVVARWGGEEFLVLTPKTELEQAAQLAEKIRAAIEAHTFVEVGKRTGSFGVASYQGDDTLTSLLHRADLAMYQAKNSGRNRVVVEKEAATT